MIITASVVKSNLNKAFDMFETAGISLNPKPTFEIKVTKASSYFAQVGTTNNRDHYILSVSRMLEVIGDDADINAELVDTLVHEIIHTQPGCFNHGTKFHKYADILNAAFPGVLHVDTYGNLAKYHVTREQLLTYCAKIKSGSKVVYQITCPCCKNTWNYARDCKMVKLVRAGRPLNCGRCGTQKFSLKTVRV